MERRAIGGALSHSLDHRPRTRIRYGFTHNTTAFQRLQSSFLELPTALRLDCLITSVLRVAPMLLAEMTRNSNLPLLHKGSVAGFSGSDQI
jgi:hypothetical protein